MKRWFKMLTGSLAVVLFITFSCAAFAAAPVKLRTAWLDEHEAVSYTHLTLPTTLGV